MTTAANESDTAKIADAADVALAVRGAYESRKPVFPVGGQTSLDYGSSPACEGLRLDLTGLRRIVDYTPRDMTIVVEAGLRMTELAATLAIENQQLPIDVPRAAEATVGGAVATNWSGSRRYGYGTFRDYVIGVHAVDGRGVAFQGGGRVVKNVAGYDFCKLLTGSLGTLGVITQLAFKVKPIAETSATIVANSPSLNAADGLLGRLNELPSPPTAIDLLAGSGWHDLCGPSDNQSPQSTIALVVRIEGTEAEVNWLAERAQYDLWTAATEVRRLSTAEADALWSRLNEFSDRGPNEAADQSPLVLKFAVPSSMVCRTIDEVLKHDPACTIQAHAASGVIYARFATFAQADLNPILVGRWRPMVSKLGGSVVVVSTMLDGLTPHIRWGGRTDATILMESIKRQFDPHGILNPGQFVY